MKAFPTTAQTWDIHNGRDLSGMDLRDYFASDAMKGQINNPLKLGDDEAHRLIAERAYRMADAMIKQRGKTSE
jgi:hypothetical protein